MIVGAFLLKNQILSVAVKIFIFTSNMRIKLTPSVFKQGFDQMIEAAHSGLPVDMGQVS